MAYPSNLSQPRRVGMQNSGCKGRRAVGAVAKSLGMCQGGGVKETSKNECCHLLTAPYATITKKGQDQFR